VIAEQAHLRSDLNSDAGAMRSGKNESVCVIDGELQSISRLLQSEARGYFAAGRPVVVGRAPGRLDVMGGVADYSGSVVLEWPLADAAVVVLQRRDDRRLRVWSIGPEAGHLSRDRFEMSLDDLTTSGAPRKERAIRAFFADRDARWAGYVLGAFYVLQAEEGVRFDLGADLLLQSSVPLGAGVASSAALEVATMSAIEQAYGLALEDLRFARLCQLVEHRVVGAPCGIMDQVTCALGRSGDLLALRCQPHELLGYETLPEDCRIVGLDSGVKHSVGAGRYVRARVGAFMGLKIITGQVGAVDGGQAFGGYLCNITPAEFREHCYGLIPSRIRGAEFLATYGEIDDSVTQVDPETVYSPRGCTEHAVYENDRVRRFAKCLASARAGDRSALARAGELMYGSHWSYSSRIGLGSAETNLMVQIARRYAARGVRGAKITGGGSGGTVAVLLDERAAGDGDDPVLSIAREYEERSGNRARVVAGTSPGARQWAVRVLDA
jgi:L-arabinokinase